MDATQKQAQQAQIQLKEQVRIQQQTNLRIAEQPLTSLPCSMTQALTVEN